MSMEHTLHASSPMQNRSHRSSASSRHAHARRASVLAPVAREHALLFATTLPQRPNGATANEARAPSENFSQMYPCPLRSMAAGSTTSPSPAQFLAAEYSVQVGPWPRLSEEVQLHRPMPNRPSCNSASSTTSSCR